VSYALSPSHLLNGRRLTTTPNSEHYEIISTHNSLVQRNKQQKHLLNQFLGLWRKTYLLGLREHHLVKKKQHNKNSVIAVGDVVVLKNDSTKRHFWKLAIVQQLLKGHDEVVRAAIIKVVDGEGKSSLLRRSIQHLIPIEVSSDETGTARGQFQAGNETPTSTTAHHDTRSSNETPISSDCNITSNIPSRPRRHAAVVGEINRQLNS